MFTSIAFVLMAGVAWLAKVANDRDRNGYDQAVGEDAFRALLLHVRQDLKLVAFLLGGIIVMLGVIADRLH